MKTTIEIADAVLVEAKRLAHEQGITVRELVEDGLRKVLAERRAVTGYRLRRVTFGGRGLRPELRNAPWERVRETSYEGRGA